MRMRMRIRWTLVVVSPRSEGRGTRIFVRLHVLLHAGPFCRRRRVERGNSRSAAKCATCVRLPVFFFFFFSFFLKHIKKKRRRVLSVYIYTHFSIESPRRLQPRLVGLIKLPRVLLHVPKIRDARESQLLLLLLREMRKIS